MYFQFGQAQKAGARHCRDRILQTQTCSLYYKIILELVSSLATATKTRSEFDSE